MPITMRQLDLSNGIRDILQKLKNCDLVNEITTY